MRLFVSLLLLAASLSSTGCGTLMVEEPVAPVAVLQASALEPAPPDVRFPDDPDQFCGHASPGVVAQFRRHFNASDGEHYHGWMLPEGGMFWVRC
jgi:hypothetical protein